MCASPQYEDGYTKIANEIQDHLCSFRIPGEVRQVIDAVIRKTYGYGKKEDRISHSQLLELTKQDKGNLSRSLCKAIEHNLVVKSDNKLSFQKNWEQWIPFARVVKSDKKESVVISATAVVKSDKNLLSKVTDTKEKKETITKEIKKSIKKESFFPDLPGILLSKEEYDKLLKEFGVEDTRRRCEALFLYMGSHGKKYASHYMTILSWDRMEKKREPKQEEPKKALSTAEYLKAIGVK
jgi:phage replication O-like protein O